MPAAAWRPYPVVRMSRGAWAPPAAHVRLSQAGMAVKDIAQPASQRDWAGRQWTKESAVAAYRVASLLWAVREKVAFSTVFFQKLIADPRTLGVINKDPDGAVFIDTVNTALIPLSRQFSIPNLMSSVRNLLAALEVNVLPQLGVSVRGMVPIFRGEDFPGRPNSLDCSQVAGNASARETVDMGDLCASAILADSKALGSEAQKAAQMLVPPPFANVLFLPDVVKPETVSETSGKISPVLKNPDLAKTIQGMDNRQLMDNLPVAQKLWKTGVHIGTLGWIAIGAGALGAAWLVASLIPPSPSAGRPGVGRRRRV